MPPSNSGATGDVYLEMPLRNLNEFAAQSAAFDFHRPSSSHCLFMPLGLPGDFPRDDFD
jgi:hypothetical protein